MALVNVFLQLLHMFSDLGIRQCVMAHPRGDEPAFLRTAWTMQAIRGLLLWLLSIAIAWPVAQIYESRELLWLIPMAGFTAVMDGFLSTNMLVLNRRMMRGRLVLLELSAYAGSMAIAVWIVWWVSKTAGDNPEADRLKLLALIGAGLTSSIVQTIVGYFYWPRLPHRFSWDREAVRDLWQYGGWVFLNTACYFLAGQADRLVIGRMDKNELGVYNLAAQLSLLPLALIYELCNQLVLTVYGRLLQPGGDRAQLRSVHRTMGLVAAYLITGLIAVGPTFFRAFFKPDYHGAGFYTQLLAAGTWFAVLQYMSETVLIAHRHSRPLAFAQMAKLTILLPCMWLGWHWGGLIGLVIGFKAPEVFRYLLLAVLAARRGFALFWDDLLLTVLIAGGSALTIWTGPWIAGSLSLRGQFGVEVGLVTLFWAAVYFIWHWRGSAGWRLLRGTTAETHPPELPS
jgi:O-antigen/teichoic acid export membrane protein